LIQVERLKDFHSLGYVHNDIKLANILITNENPLKISLVDYGISSKFEKGTGSGKLEHISLEQTELFMGNLLFSSRASCKGFTTSRKDDLESVFYLFQYLYSGKYLPWGEEMASH
jgi:serine/threonine protein kinase